MGAAPQAPRPGARMRALGLLAVRWSGLAMALFLLLQGRAVEAAVAMLVALAQVLGWRQPLPLRWEVALSGTCLVAAVSSYWDLYARVPAWDSAVHLALTGQLALLGAIMLRRPPTVPLLAAIGGALALVWELLEQWGHHHVDASVHVPPGDTALDVAMGVLGSVLVASAWMSARHSAPTSARGDRGRGSGVRRVP